MSQQLLFFVTIFISFPLWASRFEPVIQPIGLAEKIVVRGYKGKLQVVPTESETLKVEAEKKGEGDGWNFEVRQKQNVIEIRVKSSVEQEGWENLRAEKSIPAFEIRITAPQRPMEVFWNEGQVFTENWGADLSLQMTKGKAKFTKGKGNLNVQMIDGSVEVTEQEGRLALQTFKGQVLLKKNKGSLTLNNHSALYTIDDQEGPVEIENFSGSTNITKMKGNANVHNVSGVIRMRGFEGSFTGDFAKGSLDAKVESFQNFNVNSDDAAITLDVPKESGAQVLLRSEKGRLWAPIHLEKLKKGGWEERKGRLKGKEQGNIKIVSKYGDIVLR